MARKLIKGGWVVSMDSAIGDIHGGDVLIEDDKIVEVGRNIDAVDAEVIDATRMIVAPGLINGHEHTWQTGVRGTVSNWTMFEYSQLMHATAVPHFTPDDVRIANLCGALNQLNCGTTTLFDWHHCNATTDHTDAAIDSLEEAGIRAIYGHGQTKTDPKPGEKPFNERPHSRERIERLRKGRLASDDGLVTMAMCIQGIGFSVWECIEHDVRLAKDMGLRWSNHTGALGVPMFADDAVHKLDDLGLLGPDADFVHGTNLTDDEMRLIIDRGGSITVAPECECNFGHGNPVTGKVLELGGTPSFGIDLESNISGDMFSAVRFGLQVERAMYTDARPRPTKTMPDHLKTRVALEWATIGNARAMGMDDRIGSLTPGKQADVILVHGTDINTCPVHDPVQTLVFMTTPHNIDTVLVAGEYRKRDRKLVYPEAALRQKLEELATSGQRILDAAGVFEAHAAE
ncbi:MAG: amidohydrolase family protein [Alphaproteobacteria bacterium]